MNKIGMAFLAIVPVLAGCQSPTDPAAQEKAVQAVQARVNECRDYFYGMKTKADFEDANLYVLASCIEIGAITEQEYYAHLDAVRRAEVAAGRL